MCGTTKNFLDQEHQKQGNCCYDRQKWQKLKRCKCEKGASVKVPVCRLSGDESAQRCEGCVHRIGAISLPGIGGGPLADLHMRWWSRGAQPPHHGPQTSTPSSHTHFSLSVHLDVEGRWGRRGRQAKRRGVGGSLLRARAFAAILLIVFGEESDVAV